MKIRHKIILGIYIALLPSFLIAAFLMLWRGYAYTAAERSSRYERAVAPSTRT